MPDKESKAGGQVDDKPPADEGEKLPKIDPRLAVWLILFILGGGLLALYYSGLHYFPVVSWQDSLTYLALMAIIGGGLLVTYSFLLFVPGAIWSKFLVRDEELCALFAIVGRTSESCPWVVMK